MRKLARTTVLKEVKKICEIFNSENREHKIESFNYDEGILTIDGRKIDCSNMLTVDEVTNELQAYIWVTYY